MNSVRPKWISLTLAALGAAISLYLLWRRAVLVGENPGQGSDVCLALFGLGCDGLLTSSETVRFGLPVAGWGLTYYATLAVLLLVGHFLGEAFEFEANLTAFLLSIPAFLVGLALSGAMLTAKAPLCPLCVLAHLINLTLLFSLWRLTSCSPKQVLQALKAAAGYLVTGKTADPVQARWKLFGILAVSLVAIVLYQRVLLVVGPQGPVAKPTFDPQQVVRAYEANPPQEIGGSPDDPSMGPPDAPVQIVVFSEFECPACRRHAPELHGLVKRYPGKVRVVFKHFPLSKSCNPTMKGDLHPGACDAAYAAEAARRQGKFWAFHDKLFENHLHGEDHTNYNAFAQSLGLDVPRFEADRLSQATRAKVQSDVELAARLKVHGTPTLFLNRRRVPTINPRAVRMLIDRTLAAHRTVPIQSGGD